MSETTYRPTTVAELSAIVMEAAAHRRPLEIRGGGTKVRMGRLTQTAATIETTALNGITLYEPAEMVIAARAGTRLAEVEATLAKRGQMLPFEPMDHRPLLGSNGEPTIGGIVAAHVSGPRRLTAGACRDALIGAKFVNGRGEEIVSGGRVMKNVTGYDLLKVQAGAWGTLGVLTEVTFRVLPQPAASTTLVWQGLDETQAVALLCKAVASPFEVSAAAHLPDGRTCLRLENFPQSLDYRCERLAQTLRHYGAALRLEGTASRDMWRSIRDADALMASPQATIWRVSTAPTKGPHIAAAVRAAHEARALFDWSGGLVWLAIDQVKDGGEAAVRAAVKANGGHATLVRTPEEMRGALAPFEPQPDALMALTRRLKATFDPAGLFNPGRMYAGV